MESQKPDYASPSNASLPRHVNPRKCDKSFFARRNDRPFCSNRSAYSYDVAINLSSIFQVNCSTDSHDVVSNLPRNGNAAPNRHHISLKVAQNHHIAKKTCNGAFVQTFCHGGGSKGVSLVLRRSRHRHKKNKK